MTVTADNFANFATTTLSGGAGGVGTSLNPSDTTAYATSGAVLPASVPFSLLISAGAANEIVKCTAITGGPTNAQITITRAQEGTSALTWAIGATLANDVTAGNLANLWTAVQTAIPLANGWPTSLVLPRAGLITEHTKNVIVDKGSVLTLGTATLANISGAGVMRSLWLATGYDVSGVLDGRIKVTVDGTLIMDMDVGTIFLAHGGTNQAMACDHMSMEYTNSNPWCVANWNYPIPYTTSLLVQYYNPSTNTLSSLYSRVAYTTVTPPAGMKVTVQGARFKDQPLTLTAVQGGTFFDYSGKGWLAYFSMYTRPTSGTAQTYLERPISCYIDGEGSPSYTSSGTEDWFTSGWYGEARAGVSKPWAMIGTNNTGSPYDSGFALDVMALLGGIRFETELKMTWDADADVTVPTQSSWFALLYTGI